MPFSPLCQMNGGCMGCCGRNFGSPEQIKEAITKSTAEFTHAHPQKRTEFLHFRDRYHVDNLNHGVCRNLIEEKGCFLCPLHPARHKEDLRIGHCDVNHLCATAKEFATWHIRKQDTFIDFIATKNLTNIDYSLKMVKGELLKEFMEGREQFPS
ncbi:MAG TPA: hypothetical protein VJI15_02010 [Candidatus Nanoarchaeia archaeon]|nr:hypothetical protein [Candidatus Nanoarchaeia archaeon]